ncbi:hypothetical protein T484DRAFT_2399519 [Baffinella frigidus]|nr:hypothetical protein T484DRAFT_2399519 [Cryptophyta sp. CCMP2293]
MPHILAAITKKVHDLGGDDFVEGSSATKIVTRAGLNIMKISDMPPKVFVLMGQEAYLYPTENIGEVFKVPLAESSRSITVEVLSHSPQLLIVRNFLAPSECEDVIKAATPKMEPSTVLKQGDQTSGENKVRDSVRTSSTAWMMDRNVPIVKALRERTEELMGAQNDWTEDLQVLRYEPKQHYHVHTDYFDPKLYANDKRWAAGHNRLATVFFYLTTVEEGGQTVFPYGNTRKEDFARVHAYGRCEDALPTALKVHQTPKTQTLNPKL